MSARRAAAAAAALLALRSVASAATEVPPGDVGGQTWTAAGSPYHLTGDVVVPAGATLQIEAGAEVRVAAGDAAPSASGKDGARTEIVVQGTLVTSGTPASPVRLLADGVGGASSWYGIVLVGTGTATLATTEISSGVNCLHADTTGAVAMAGGSVRACQRGVFVTRGNPTLSGIEMTETTIAGLFVAGGGAQASALHVHGNSSYGVSVGDANLSLSGSLVHDNARNGVNVLASWGNRDVTITGCTIAYNGWNGVVLDASSSINANLVAHLVDDVVANNALGGIGNVGSAATIYATHDVVWGNPSGDLPVAVDDVGGTMVENPLFVDGPGRDLRIGSRSPARLHGSNGGDIGALPWDGALTTALAGHLYVDTTLGAAASPHDVAGDLTVEPGVTLTIEPGTTVRFATTDLMGGNASATRTELLVEGTLLAAGTAQQPVSLVPASASPAPGDWDGVVLLPTATGTVLEHAAVSHAVNGIRSSGDATNRIASTEVVRSSLDGVQVWGGAAALDALRVHGSGRHGVLVVSAAPALTNLVVHDNAEDGIRVEGLTASGPAAVEVLHATVVANARSNVRVRAQGAASAVTLQNSIVASSPGEGVVVEGAGATVAATYDDVWGNATDWLGATAGTGSFGADPLFVSAAAGDFRLKPGSPCIDSAAATAVAVDADGRARPIDGDASAGAAPDVGAYEYDPATAPPDSTPPNDGPGGGCGCGASGGSPALALVAIALVRRRRRR